MRVFECVRERALVRLRMRVYGVALDRCGKICDIRGFLPTAAVRITAIPTARPGIKLT